MFSTFFRPECYLATFWKNSVYSKFESLTIDVLFYPVGSALLQYSLTFFIEAATPGAVNPEAREVRRSDSSRATKEVGSARVGSEVRRHLGQVLPCDFLVENGHDSCVVRVPYRSLIGFFEPDEGAVAIVCLRCWILWIVLTYVALGSGRVTI